MNETIISELVEELSLQAKQIEATLNMLSEGANLRSVQELLGHANLSTTQVYTHLSNDRIRNIYLKAHPSVSFHESKIDEYQITKNYDLVIAKHIVMYMDKEYVL